MAEQEQRRSSQGNGSPPHPRGNDAPPEARHEAGTGRTYRGVRGRGRGLIPNSRGRRQGGPVIEYLPSQSESSQHTPDPRTTGRTRPWVIKEIRPPPRPTYCQSASHATSNHDYYQSAGHINSTHTHSTTNYSCPHHTYSSNTSRPTNRHSDPNQQYASDHDG